MSLSRLMSLARRVSLLGCTVFMAAVFADAQSPNPDQAFSNAVGYSSSQDGLSASGLQLISYALPSTSDPGGSAAEGGGQYGNNRGGGGQKNRLFHNWTFELGGGFGAPVANDTPYITWGGNFTLGGGLRFSNRFSTLLEYQFMDNKLPGAFIAAASAANGGGITGGNAHINSITGSPVIDLFPKKSNGIYAVGGFGYYHKSTNFSAPEAQFDPFYGYYYANVTVASFSSDQWGGNAGLGIYHRMGNMYGGESHTQLFAEARYTFLHTPPLTQSNGLGTTALIPVTLGVRF